MAEEMKKWYLSKTIWGGVLMAAGVIAGFFGVEIDETTQEEVAAKIPEIIEYVSGAVGFILVIWGRITASKKVTA